MLPPLFVSLDSMPLKLGRSVASLTSIVLRDAQEGNGAADEEGGAGGRVVPLAARNSAVVPDDQDM